MSRTEVDIIDRDELFNRAWLRLNGCVEAACSQWFEAVKGKFYVGK